jgi:hypothetical protein
MGFYTAIEGLDFYRGEINAEWATIRSEVTHLYASICLAENAAGVEDNTFGSQDFDDAFEQFSEAVEAIKDRINNHKKGTDND